MDIYLKATAGVLITAILCLVLSKHGKDIAMLLALCVCCMVVITAAAYLTPVITFAKKIASIGKINDDTLEILLKIIGIGFISQIAGFICADAGRKSLEKVLQILTTAVIICISIPIFEQMLSLIENVLGEL